MGHGTWDMRLLNPSNVPELPGLSLPTPHLSLLIDLCIPGDWRGVRARVTLDHYQPLAKCLLWFQLGEIWGVGEM